MAASGAEYVVTIQISIVTTIEPDTNQLYVLVLWYCFGSLLGKRFCLY